MSAESNDAAPSRGVPVWLVILIVVFGIALAAGAFVVGQTRKTAEGKEIATAEFPCNLGATDDPPAVQNKKDACESAVAGWVAEQCLTAAPGDWVTVVRITIEHGSVLSNQRDLMGPTVTYRNELGRNSTRASCSAPAPRGPE